MRLVNAAFACIFAFAALLFVLSQITAAGLTGDEIGQFRTLPEEGRSSVD